MDIGDSQRIKQIRDNTEKMADAFTRIADATDAFTHIADALERLTEPHTMYYPQVDGITPSVIVQCYLRESCNYYGDKQICGRCREYNLYSHTKTDLQTEYPCNTCANKGDRDGECSNCVADSELIRWKTPSHYKPKDEPQTKCETCKHYKLACGLFSEICKYEPKDKPQTEDAYAYDEDDWYDKAERSEK